MSTVLKLRLPKALEPERERIEEALGKYELAAWPEGEKFTDALEPKAVAGCIIPYLHEHLLNAEIAYLFREKMERRGSTILGKASKASSRLRFLTGHEFVIEFNWTAWRELTPESRLALVDHELAHFDYDPEKAKYAMRDHDVEEFTEILQRWGTYKPGLVEFLAAAPQLELFNREEE